MAGEIASLPIAERLEVAQTELAQRGPSSSELPPRFDSYGESCQPAAAGGSGMKRHRQIANVISVDRTNVGTLRTRLAACRKAVERLDRVERRLGRIAAPYAAKAVVEGLRLHLAGQDQYAHWRAFLERRGIVLRRSAKSPCQGAARLMLQ